MRGKSHTAIAKIAILGDMPKIGHFLVFWVFGHFWAIFWDPPIFPIFLVFPVLAIFQEIPIFAEFLVLVIFGVFWENWKNGDIAVAGKIVKICHFCVFVKSGDFGETWKMAKMVKNVKICDFGANMKYAVFRWFGGSFFVETVFF